MNHRDTEKTRKRKTEWPQKGTTRHKKMQIDDCFFVSISASLWLTLLCLSLCLCVSVVQILSYDSGYSAIVNPRVGISCNRRQPRVMRRSSSPTYSASKLTFAKAPSQTTASNPASTIY